MYEVFLAFAEILLGSERAQQKYQIKEKNRYLTHIFRLFLGKNVITQLYGGCRVIEAAFPPGLPGS